MFGDPSADAYLAVAYNNNNNNNIIIIINNNNNIIIIIIIIIIICIAQVCRMTSEALDGQLLACACRSPSRSTMTLC